MVLGLESTQLQTTCGDSTTETLRELADLRAQPQVESVDPRPQMGKLPREHSIPNIYSSELGEEDQHLTALGYRGVAQSALEVLLRQRAVLAEVSAPPEKK